MRPTTQSIARAIPVSTTQTTLHRKGTPRSRILDPSGDSSCARLDGAVSDSAFYWPPPLCRGCSPATFSWPRNTVPCAPDGTGVIFRHKPLDVVLDTFGSAPVLCLYCSPTTFSWSRVFALCAPDSPGVMLR